MWPRLERTGQPLYWWITIWFCFLSETAPFPSFLHDHPRNINPVKACIASFTYFFFLFSCFNYITIKFFLVTRSLKF